MSEPKRRNVLADEVLKALAEMEVSTDEARYLKGVDPKEALRLLAPRKSLGGVIGVDLKAKNVAQNLGSGLTPGKVTSNVRPKDRYTKKVPVRDLKPSSVNGDIWCESLEAESIEALARDIDEHGLRQMIEVNEDLAILDGERRWRAHMSRDHERIIEVVVVPGVTEPDQIKEYILAAYTSVRDASITERVRVFALAIEVLKRKHGRRRGRPEKITSDEAIYWPEQKIKKEAATRAGFTSAEIARRASKVITEGDDDVRRALASGEISISRAYEQMSQPVPQDQDPLDQPQGGDTLEQPQDQATPAQPQGGDTLEQPQDQATLDEPHDGDTLEQPQDQATLDQPHDGDTLDHQDQDDILEQLVDPDDLDEEPSSLREVPDEVEEQEDGEAPIYNADEESSEPPDSGVYFDDILAESVPWEDLDEIREQLIPAFRRAAEMDPSRAMTWHRDLGEAFKVIVDEATKKRSA